MNQVVARNEFSVESTTKETASSAVAARAKSEIETRYLAAFRNPRDMDVVREQLLKECKRPAFAAVARYVKPIGKDKSKWPAGPSIRFAEAAVRIMRNITVETVTVYDDREKRIIRVTVVDLEANVPYSDEITVAKTIERRSMKEGDTVISTRRNSYGDLLYILEATDDDIINKQRALISKAIRTEGLRLIPGDIVDECMEAVLETQNKTDAQDPDAAKRKVFDGFAALGVRADQLKEYLGHSAETLNPAELTDLRALFAAIRDGESNWREVMDAKAGTEAKETTGAAAGGAAGLKAAATANSAKEAKGKPKPPAATEGAPTFTYAELAEQIKATKNRDECGVMLDAARSLPADQFDGLKLMVDTKFPPTEV